MEFFILDSNKRIIDILYIGDGDNSIFNDTFSRYLETGAETYTATIKLTEKSSTTVLEGNYILFKWRNKYRMMQIKTCEDNEVGGGVRRTIYAETIALELYNSHIRPATIEGNVEMFLMTVLQDSNYRVGVVSPTLEHNIQTIRYDKVTPVYSVLQDAVSLFGNIELEFRVECIDSINGQYQFFVDAFADGERGALTYKRFEYDFNIYGTKRTADITDFCAGLIAEGKGGITFKDIRWEIDRGDPMDKPLGQDFLLDPIAHRELNNGGKPILGSFTSNAETPIDLLWDTYYKLQEVKQTKFSYDVPIYMSNAEYEEIGIGDTVYVINPKFNPPIQLEARIGQIDMSFSDPYSSQVKLTNYKQVKSKLRNINQNDIIADTVHAILGMGVGKLTEANIALIKDLLIKLDMEKEEIDSIIDRIQDALKPPIPLLPPTVPEDSEDYTKITVNKLDGGLWLGDARIYDLKKNNVATVITTTETTIERPISSSQSSAEYKEAVKYYKQWDLGKSQNNATLANLMSNSNKYKIGYMVRYWAGKFGLDTRLIYALMMQESSGNPYSATSSSIGGYGLMQCERGVYFNKKQTIKFLDGSTKSFTPSYNTMQPGKGGTTTVNGVKVDKNINNQIMFGCHELRKCIEKWKFNIFATLVGYNMGVGAMGWILIKYVCDTYGYTFNNGRVVENQPTKIKQKCYEVLETYKMPWASWRQQWKDYNGGGTVKHVEYVLRYYKPYNNSLPYCKDKKGKKIGYGVNPPAVIESSPTTGAKVRAEMVKLAKSIVQDHKDGKATYDQAYRTINYDKPKRHPGTFYGLKNPVCYDCSSFVSSVYYKFGFKSAYNGTCSGGTLVANSVKKTGWSAWKCNDAGIAKAKPGDIIMVAKSKVTESGNISNPKKYTTKHTIIYCGDGMIAHASKWAYKPQAIRYESINYYKNQGTCFFLRPYDLAEADKRVSEEVTTVPGTGETIIYETIVQENKIVEQTLKGLVNATAKDYIKDNLLVQNVEINNIEDTLAFPSSPSYVFVHFGVGGLDDDSIEATKNLLIQLRNKYKNTPIFIAKELKVSSAYPNYDSINTQVDNYNNAMATLCNEEDYIIQLKIENSSIASNGTILSSLTSDGYRFKDKASMTKYYNACKDAIKNKRIGGINKTISQTTISNKKVNITMNKGQTYKCGTVASISINTPNAKFMDFWSRVIFTTNKNTEPTKFIQDELIWLDGTDCIEGALVPKADTTYTITCMVNTSEDEYGGSQYFGTVTGISKGGSYTDFADFVGGTKVAEYALSYYNNRNNLTYTAVNKTPMDYANPAQNIANWKNSNGKMNISSRCIMKLCYMGIPYDKSPFANNDMTKVVTNNLDTWAFNINKTGASDYAKYCVSQGWALSGIDLTNFSNVEAGDMLFLSRSSNANYMSISDVVICVGVENGNTVGVMVDSLGTGKTVIKFNLKDTNTNYKPSWVVAVIRPRKE